MKFDVIVSISFIETSAQCLRRSVRLACNFQQVVSVIASETDEDNRGKSDTTVTDSDVDIRDRQRLSQKHDLTPKSKSSGQPERKRFGVSGKIKSVYFITIV